MFNDQDTQVSSPLSHQINRLIKMAVSINDQVNKVDIELTDGVTGGLSQLIGGLTHLSRQVALQDEEHDNLVALANIGQVINSSLDLNEVLRIVMDTIVRLTGAERGFLMLRDENGELTINLARNWEQESLDPSEFEISRTIVDRVTAEGQPVSPQ